nr:outer membrane protein assembly factor BamD [Myxococcota bacterium]
PPATAPLPSTAAVPTRVPALPPTPDRLYAAAEAALAARDLAGADHALGRLVTEFPASSLIDQAHYERARIAYQQRAWAAARRHLDRLAAIPRTPLAEPGHYLACRIAVQARDGEAAQCLSDYRRTFPTSPHDLEALALIVQLTHASRGCAGAAAAIAELVRTHPRAKLATAWRTRCPERP